MERRFKYYEFFAGTGMARAGLGPGWRCLFANDCDESKVSAYRDNWGAEHLDARDVALVRAAELSEFADLAWASFPCQDVSQAGAKAGVGGSGGGPVTRSGAIWPFLEIIGDLADAGRHPYMIALENVVGLLSSNGGADFRAICSALGSMGYCYGAVVVDAMHFVPQSRPRVFIIALRRDVQLPPGLHGDLPAEPWHTQTLIRARAGLSQEDSAHWVWWNLGDAPEAREMELADIIDLSDNANWDTEEATGRLIGMMSDMQLQRLNNAKAQEGPIIGSLYLRMRPTGKSGNVQRAEIAFGQALGCLRTPKGGASRPRIVMVKGKRVRTRLLSAREAATLMGLAPSFVLPRTYNEAFRLIGDGVVPQVVRFVASRLLEPLALHARASAGCAAERKALG